MDTIEQINNVMFIDDFQHQQRINFQINKDHGFEEEFNFGEKIALLHGELSEALEWSRKDFDTPSDHIPEFTGIEEEFADVIIRIQNIAERKGLRIAEAMIAKQAFNRTRPYKHGGKTI